LSVQRQPRGHESQPVGGAPARRVAAAPLRATIARLQTTAGNRATTQLIQRLVMKRRNPQNLYEWKYYSSLATDELFDTELEALERDRQLEATRASEGMIFEESERSPTLYTYTHQKSHTVFGALQGPHTVTHADVTERLKAEETADDLRRVFAEQVPDPKAIRAIVEGTEAAPHLKGDLLARYMCDYTWLYAAIEAALAEKAPPLERIKEMLSAAMDMHPYASFGWKSSKKVAQSSSAGKGEGARRKAAKLAEMDVEKKGTKRKAEELGDDPLVDVMIDKRGARSFKDRAAYIAFVKRRLSWIRSAKKAKTEE
jgi:hypothetical protein